MFGAKCTPDASFCHTSTVKANLTGDGTYIGPRQHIVTFGFTILDEGDDARSLVGNHTVCTVHADEDYNSLSVSLRDITASLCQIIAYNIMSCIRAKKATNL